MKIKKIIVLIILFSLFLMGQIAKINQGEMKLIGANISINLKTHTHGMCKIYRYNKNKLRYDLHDTSKNDNGYYTISRGEGFWVISDAKNKTNCIIDTNIVQKLEN